MSTGTIQTNRTTRGRRGSRHAALSALLALMLALTMLPWAPSQASAKAGDTFTVANADGVDITYKVLYESSAVSTVQVGMGDSNSQAVGTGTEGGLTIPATVEYGGTAYAVTGIGDHAFYGCTSLASVAIPEGVTGIGDYAFYGCTSLASVAIPEGVTGIGNHAFRNCTSLASVTIPEGVTGIGTYAFRDCTSLASVTIPEGVTGIGASAFYGCTSLASVTIPEGVTGIGAYTFHGCTSLASVTIPEGVTGIGDYAFYGCTSLASVAIPEGVTGIGVSAFRNCTSLASVTIPEGVTGIAERMFQGCTSLASVTIPEGVTGIGDYAFRDCTALASVTIPSSLRSIGANAFYSCSSLASVAIPEGVTGIGASAFYGCSSLASVVIPEGVTGIGVSAFHGCTSLASVTIPEGVTGIGNQAFRDCSSLASLTIPESVTSIGGQAFYNCTSLASLTFLGDSAPTVGATSFTNVPATGTLYYPEADGAGESYAAAFQGKLPSGWQLVAVPAGPEAITGTTTIEAGGTYALDAALAGATITIATTEPVTLVGNGVGDGGATGANTGIAIIGFAEGIDLTLKDVKIINTGTGKNVIDFTGGENRLAIEGVNLLELEEGGGGSRAMVHVPAAAALAVEGTGTLYFYKSSQGAGFGSDKGEKNGDMAFSGVTLFGKSTKPGPAIGSGASYSGAPGNITFNSGEYTLIANAMGACIGGGSGGGGGTPANPGGNVYIKGGTFNINVDWAGAAIGGGGYNGGNDAVGGNLVITGGSLRTVCDENALSNWASAGVTEYGVTDKVITAKKTDGDGAPVHQLVFDTSLLEVPASSFAVEADGAEVYAGGGHHYKFVNEEKDKDTGGYAQISNTLANWVELDEQSLYLYLTGEDHELTVNGEPFDAAWDEDTQTFTVAAPVPEPKTGQPGSGDFDGDGSVTASDALVAATSVIGSAVLTDAQKAAVDIDGDGALTMADVVLIMRKAMGL